MKKPKRPGRKARQKRQQQSRRTIPPVESTASCPPPPTSPPPPRPDEPFKKKASQLVSIGAVMAAIAGIVALAGGWDLYVDTVPDVFPSHEGVHPLSSFPFTITNDSNIFGMDAKSFECKLNYYKITSDDVGPKDWDIYEFSWNGTGTGVLQTKTKNNRIEATINHIAPIISKDQNIYIPPRKGQRTFWCDITGNFDGPFLSRKEAPNAPRISIPFHPVSASITVVVKYSTDMLPFDWRARLHATEPFVLTYATDGFFWSQTEPVR